MHSFSSTERREFTTEYSENNVLCKKNRLATSVGVCRHLHRYNNHETVHLRINTSV
jgi:hypothetical protein